MSTTTKRLRRGLAGLGLAVGLATVAAPAGPAAAQELPSGCRWGSYYDQYVWGYAGFCTIDGHTYWFDFDGGYGWAWWLY